MSRSPRTRPGSVVGLRGWWGALGAVVIALASCGGSDAQPSTAGRLASQPSWGMPINPYRAADLAALIAKAGLPIPDQHDVTARDCPRIGCVDKIESATVSISTFPTTGSAEIYAGATHHDFLIANVVMEFGPTVNPYNRHSYEAVLTGAIA